MASQFSKCKVLLDEVNKDFKKLPELEKESEESIEREKESEELAELEKESEELAELEKESEELAELEKESEELAELEKESEELAELEKESEELAELEKESEELAELEKESEELAELEKESEELAEEQLLWLIIQLNLEKIRHRLNIRSIFKVLFFKSHTLWLLQNRLRSFCLLKDLLVKDLRFFLVHGHLFLELHIVPVIKLLQIIHLLGYFLNWLHFLILENVGLSLIIVAPLIWARYWESIFKNGLSGFGKTFNTFLDPGLAFIVIQISFVNLNNLKAAESNTGLRRARLTLIDFFHLLVWLVFLFLEESQKLIHLFSYLGIFRLDH